MRAHAEAQSGSRPAVRTFAGGRPVGAGEHQWSARILQREQDLSPDRLLQQVHRVRFGEGRELLARELAQVLQQPRKYPPGSLATSSRHDPDAQQAERRAETSTSPDGRFWPQPIAMPSTAGGLQRCQGMACPPAGCDHGTGLREGSGSSGAGGFARPASSHELTRRLGMRVTAPNDPSEREADRIAGLVLGTSTQASPQAADSAGHGLQRGVGTDGGSAPPHVVRGGGTALPVQVRGFFEPRFGRDLSSVRVHSDDRAASSARSVGALAYTMGQEVVFAAGRYAPDTTVGRRLLAHELAHVIQQGGDETAPDRSLGRGDPSLGDQQARRTANEGPGSERPIHPHVPQSPGGSQGHAPATGTSGSTQPLAARGRGRTLLASKLTHVVPHSQEAASASGQLMRTSEPRPEGVCACGGAECSGCGKTSSSGLQTELDGSGPEDILDREADRAADQVLATPAHPATPTIQRFEGHSNRHTDVAPDSVHTALDSPGSPLEPALRRDMEQRFGHDLSRVRVHAGGAAEQSARDVDAQAYTAGHDIVFGAGRFTLDTHRGRRLLAHELAHVVQQQGRLAAGRGPQNIQRTPKKKPPPQEPPPPPPIRQVIYGETHLSRRAQTHRIDNPNLPDSANILVVDYETARTGRQIQVIENRPGVAHSEAEMDQFLRNVRGQVRGPVTVHEIYSERQPCGPSDSDCEGMLRKRYPNARTTFSYGYQETEAPARESRAARTSPTSPPRTRASPAAASSNGTSPAGAAAALPEKRAGAHLDPAATALPREGRAPCQAVAPEAPGAPPSPQAPGAPAVDPGRGARGRSYRRTSGSASSCGALRKRIRRQNGTVGAGD